MFVFFATLANADDWVVEIEIFGKEHEKFLRNYLKLPNGIPSHDTIQRVFAIVPPEFLENFQKQWNEMLNSDEGNKIIIFSKTPMLYSMLFPNSNTSSFTSFCNIFRLLINFSLRHLP